MFDKILKEIEKINILNETFASDKLMLLQGKPRNRWNNLVKALHGKNPIKWSEISDDEILELTPMEAGDKKYADYMMFWITDVEMSKEDHNFLDWNLSPGLVAVSKGKKISQDISKEIGSMRNIKHPSGIKIASVSTHVYAFSPEVIEKYSAKDQRDDRADARKGATAMMKPDEIKSINKRKYEKLLQQKNADLDIKKLVKEVFDKVNGLLDNALQANELDQSGNLLVPGLVGRRGDDVKVDTLAGMMKEVWRTMSDFSRYEKEDKRDEEMYKKQGYEPGDTYGGEKMRQLKNELRLVRDQLNQGKIDAW